VAVGVAVGVVVGVTVGVLVGVGVVDVSNQPRSPMKLSAVDTGVGV